MSEEQNSPIRNDNFIVNKHPNIFYTKQTTTANHYKKMFFTNSQGNVGQIMDVVDGYCAIRWVDKDVTIIYWIDVENKFIESTPEEIIKARKIFAT